MGRLRAAAIGGMVAMLALTSAAVALEYKEAPALAAAVSEGTLPPVAERLPAMPEIVTPAEIGVYGGTIRYGLRGSSDHNHILRMVGNQGLVRWNPEERSWDCTAHGSRFAPDGARLEGPAACGLRRLRGAG